MPPNSGFVGVATGNYHSMGLRSDGSVAAWGMCDVGHRLPLTDDCTQTGTPESMRITRPDV